MPKAGGHSRCVNDSVKQRPASRNGCTEVSSTTAQRGVAWRGSAQTGSSSRPRLWAVHLLADRALHRGMLTKRALFKQLRNTLCLQCASQRTVFQPQPPRSCAQQRIRGGAELVGPCLLVTLRPLYLSKRLTFGLDVPVLQRWGHCYGAPAELFNCVQAQLSRYMSLIACSESYSGFHRI